MDTAFFLAWMREAARVVGESAEHLTRLDAAIGDGDHGRNLARGFTAGLAALDDREPATPGEVLVTVGRALISKTGGASGPLYGGAFRRAGKALGEAAEVGPDELGASLAAAVDAIRQLGKAEDGDKTMVDALAPAVAAYEGAVRGGAGPADATRAAAEAAEKGAQATIPMQARKGRASYLGPRSVGHEDPGAASTALILRALAAVAAGAAGEGG